MLLKTNLSFYNKTFPTKTIKSSRKIYQPTGKKINFELPQTINLSSTIFKSDLDFVLSKIAGVGD